MHHQLIDHLSYLGGPIHRRDPRAKIVALLGLIFVTVLTPIQNLWHFPAYACVLAAVIAVSRVPVRYVLRHALLILPFVLVVAVFLPFLGGGDAVWSVRVGNLVLAVTREGLWILANLLVKASISVLATITLVSTTRFVDLLKGFERFGAPRIILVTLAFLYRYIFILIDEVARLKRAHDARSVGARSWRDFHVVANMIGVLLIRTYERAERIYAAMVSRGFTGEIRTLSVLRLRPSDVVFVTLVALGLMSPWLWKLLA